MTKDFESKVSDLSEKERSRKQLHKRRMLNMKRGLILVAVLLLFLSIVNYIYRQYQSHIFADKETIMVENNNRLFFLGRSFYQINTLITDMIYDQNIDKAYEKGRLDQLIEHTYDYLYFDYNYEAYGHLSIDEGRQYITDMGIVLGNLLDKEQLSEQDLNQLNRILKANKEITKVQEDIIDMVNESDHREELRYLYYYEGEAYYLMSNALEVHCLDVIDEIRLVEDAEQPVEEPITLPYDEVQMKENAELFASIFLNDIPLYIDRLEYRGKEPIPYGVTYGSDYFNDSENIYLSTDGSIIYNNHLDVSDIKIQDAMDEKAIIEICNDYIAELKEPLLTLTSVDSYLNEGNFGKSVTVYMLMYKVISEGYEDRDSFIEIQMYSNGAISNIYLHNPEILKGTYEMMEAAISEAEAIALIHQDSGKVIEKVTLYVEKEPRYGIEFMENNNRFKAYVHGNTGEIISIEYMY